MGWRERRGLSCADVGVLVLLVVIEVGLFVGVGLFLGVR